MNKVSEVSKVNGVNEVNSKEDLFSKAKRALMEKGISPKSLEGFFDDNSLFLSESDMLQLSRESAVISITNMFWAIMGDPSTKGLVSSALKPDQKPLYNKTMFCQNLGAKTLERDSIIWKAQLLQLAEQEVKIHNLEAQLACDIKPLKFSKVNLSKEEFHELQKQGLSMQKIANKMGVSKNTLLNHRKIWEQEEACDFWGEEKVLEIFKEKCQEMEDYFNADRAQQEEEKSEVF